MEKDFTELLEELTKEKWETGKITLNEDGMTLDFKRVKETPKRWRAEKNKEYWLIDYNSHSMAINSSTEQFDMVDKRRYEIGNYFKTDEEAREKLEHLEIEQQLKDIALRLNNGAKIDWKNEKQWKYYIYYDFYYNKIEDDCFAITKHQGTIYCLDGNFKDIAIAEIGENRLNNYLKEC